MSTGKDLLKLNLPVVVVASLLSVAAGAGASYAAAKAELHDTAKTADEAKASVLKAQEDVHTHTTDIAVIKTQMADFQKSLDRIEDALGTQHHGGR